MDYGPYVLEAIRAGNADRKHLDHLLRQILAEQKRTNDLLALLLDEATKRRSSPPR